jgi:hypothetical protein
MITFALRSNENQSQVPLVAYVFLQRKETEVAEIIPTTTPDTRKRGIQRKVQFINVPK